MYPDRVSSLSQRMFRYPLVPLIILQSILVLSILLGPIVLTVTIVALCFVVFFLLLPIPAGVGAFILAGAFLPLLDLKWRFNLAALLAILLLICLADLIRMIRRGRLLSERTDLDQYVWAFLPVVLVGSFIGIARGATLEEWPLEAFPYLCLILAPVASRYLTLRSIRAICSVFVVAVLIQSVLAIIFFIQGGFLRMADPRFSVHPSLVGVVLFAIAVFHPVRRWRIVAGISVLPLVFQLICSMTRGYWLGYTAGIILILIIAAYRFSRRDFGYLLLRLFGIIFIIIGITLYLLHTRGILSELITLGERFNTFANLGSDASTNIRLIEWQAAFKEFLRHPLLGGGFGLHLQFFHPICLCRVPKWWFIHNSYLLLLVKLGVVGFGAFMYFMWGVLRIAFRAIKSVEDPLAFCFAVGFTANIIQFLAIAVTNYTFSKSVNMTYLAFIIGALSAIVGSCRIFPHDQISSTKRNGCDVLFR